MMEILQEQCVGCGCCADACGFGAVTVQDGVAVVAADCCTGCGVCAEACPTGTIVIERGTAESDLSAWHGVWVVGLEREETMLSRVAQELLSEGRILADRLGTQCTLVIPGNTLYEAWRADAAAVGCDRILLLRGTEEADFQFAAAAVAQAVKAQKPEIVIFPATPDGRDLAPKVAVRLQTGLTADCTQLAIGEQGQLLQIRPTYGGSVMATIQTPERRPQMASVRPGVMEIRRETPSIPEIELFEVQQEACFGRVELLECRKAAESFLPLEEARIVLAGGYGLGSQENFQKLCQLANRIGAGVAVTRKVVDEGWAPAEMQVGQTGKTIAPEIYVAFGVSGALQHTLGISRVKHLVAVNSNPAAQIFQSCETAILADCVEVLDVLCRKFGVETV